MNLYPQPPQVQRPLPLIPASEAGRGQVKSQQPRLVANWMVNAEGKLSCRWQSEK